MKKQTIAALVLVLLMSVWGTAASAQPGVPPIAPPAPTLPPPTLPPGSWDNPVIHEFSASVPSCSVTHDPDRPLLSYWVSATSGGSGIKEVRINAIYEDGSYYRIFRAYSTVPPLPRESSRTGIRDPISSGEHVAQLVGYTLVVENARGNVVSRRLPFSYKRPPIRFELLSDRVERVRADTFWFEYRIPARVEHVRRVRAWIHFDSGGTLAKRASYDGHGSLGIVVRTSEIPEWPESHPDAEIFYQAEGFPTPCGIERSPRLRARTDTASDPPDPLPDLIPRIAELSRGSVRVQVVNQGDEAVTTPFHLRVSSDVPGGGESIYIRDRIGPREGWPTAWIDIAVEATPGHWILPHTLGVTVDPFMVVEETNEGNNAISCDWNEIRGWRCP